MNVFASRCEELGADVLRRDEWLHESEIVEGGVDRRYRQIQRHLRRRRRGRRDGGGGGARGSGTQSRPIHRWA